MHPPAPEDALIARLRELPPSAHHAAIEAACAEHPALRERLPAILATLAPTLVCASTRLPSPPAETARTRRVLDALESALAATPEDTSGARIGNYQLLDKIGEGGFGVVWMARQLAPILRPPSHARPALAFEPGPPHPIPPLRPFRPIPVPRSVHPAALVVGLPFA